MDLTAFKCFLLETGKSQETIGYYARLINSFLKFNDFTDENCKKWILEKTLKFSASCRNKYISAFKTYALFLGVDFAEKYKRIAEHADEYERLTIDETWKLIELEPYPNRMSILFLVVASTGCRPSEVLKAQKRHLSFRMIKIKSKTGEIRRIALNSFVYQKILEYLENTPINSEYIFPNYKGSVMTTAGLSKEFRKRLDILGICKNTRVYDLRHSYITRQVRNNPLPHVQKQVGHKKLDTTQHYTHPDDQDLLLLSERDSLFAENMDSTEQLSELIEEAKRRGFFNNKKFEWKISKKSLSITIQEKVIH